MYEKGFNSIQFCELVYFTWVVNRSWKFYRILSGHVEGMNRNYIYLWQFPVWCRCLESRVGNFNQKSNYWESWRVNKIFIPLLTVLSSVHDLDSYLAYPSFRMKVSHEATRHIAGERETVGGCWSKVPYPMTQHTVGTRPLDPELTISPPGLPSHSLTRPRRPSLVWARSTMLPVTDETRRLLLGTRQTRSPCFFKQMTAE